MNIKNKLSIVIPCKNEEKYISNTITEIVKQTNIKGTRIIVADGNSTDNTVNVVKNLIETYKDIVKIELINGGTVSVGRNNGAKLVDTKYILFLDADITFFELDTIDKSLFYIQHNRLDLLTCKIKSIGKDLRTSLIFKFMNLSNKILTLFRPIALGGYFMTRTDKFFENGMFDETVTLYEDFVLSGKYITKKFKIFNHYVSQDDRRFKKWGYNKSFASIFNSFFHRNNINFFKREVNYFS